MHPPDELDDYLRGGSALTRQYRREPSPSAPHTLDRAVLAMSAGTRDVREIRRRPWLAPMALAASVLLSLAMVLALVIGPQRSKHVENKPQLVRAAVRIEPQLRLYSSDPQLPRKARAWLADIAALRRAGRGAEADAELRSFRSTYPTYRLNAVHAQP